MIRGNLYIVHCSCLCALRLGVGVQDILKNRAAVSSLEKASMVTQEWLRRLLGEERDVRISMIQECNQSRRREHTQGWVHEDGPH